MAQGAEFGTLLPEWFGKPVLLVCWLQRCNTCMVYRLVYRSTTPYIKILILNDFISFSGGEEGIRTLETVSRLHTFQACAFDHSATSPLMGLSKNEWGLQGAIATCAKLVSCRNY